MKKNAAPAKPWLPRVVVPFNTGSRPHVNKKAYKRVKKVEY
jgi:hypothetical protein